MGLGEFVPTYRGLVTELGLLTVLDILNAVSPIWTRVGFSRLEKPDSDLDVRDGLSGFGIGHRADNRRRAVGGRGEGAGTRNGSGVNLSVALRHSTFEHRHSNFELRIQG